MSRLRRPAASAGPASGPAAASATTAEAAGPDTGQADAAGVNAAVAGSEAAGADTDGEDAVAVGPDADGEGAVAAGPFTGPGENPVGEAVLYGIPDGELIVYIGDQFVITSDGINARIYTVPDAAGSGAMVLGSSVYRERVNALTGGGNAADAAAPDAADGEEGVYTDAVAREPSRDAGAADEWEPGDEDEREPGDPADEAGGETSDIEAAEASSAGDERDAAENNADGADGVAVYDELAAYTVEPVTVIDNGMHMWHGLSRFRQFGGRVYFTSGAGLFSADPGFTSAEFICGDGLEIRDDFIVSGDKIIFRRWDISGEGGLFMMDIADGMLKRLFSGYSTGFDIAGNILFFIDAADGALYYLDMESDSPAVRLFHDLSFTYDAVVSREGGGLILRSPESGYRLFMVDAETLARAVVAAGNHAEGTPAANTESVAQPVPITDAGADIAAYYRDYIYYTAWDEPGVFYRLDVSRADTE